MEPNQKKYDQAMKDRLEHAFQAEEKKITGFFIKNYRFTYLIIFAVVAMGLFSLFSLPREANPEIRVPFAVVTAVLPGANPSDTEELLTDKIEEKVKNLDDLKLYNSSSGQSFSSVFVEFDASADLEESFRKLREAVDEAKPNLPEEAEDPIVTEISFSDFPIVTYSLVGDYTDVELKEFADALQENFENIKDVSRVPLQGGREREFQVIIDQTKLVNFNISLSQVVGAIARTNFNLPAGNIEVDGFKYNVRVKGKFASAEVLNEVVVTTFKDSPVYIRDLGTVVDGFKDQETESRIGFKGVEPRNTISLQIFKQTGGNILDIVDESKEVANKLHADGTLPEDLTIELTNDNSVFIRDDLNRLGRSGIQTMILIVLILLIVLSFRGAFITGLSVPIAFLMAFIFLNIEGMTLNGIVLFSLVLSLGLMVDNSIVIIEGINEYITKYGKTVYEAAVLSVWNFKWAIIAGTMTTVSAFLPLLLVSGILGEFLGVMPKTISATLISSLFVAIVVIPTLISRFLKVKQLDNGTTMRDRDKARHQHVRNFRRWLKVHYSSFLRSVLPSKKRRRLMLGAAWLLFVLSVMLPATGLMKIEMFGNVDVDYFIMNIRLPAGSALIKTKAVTEQVERIIAEIPELDNYVTNIGSSLSLDVGAGGSSATHLANLTVNLVDDKERDRKSFEVAESIRPQLNKIQGADIRVEELSAGPPTGAPIEMRLTGDDLIELADISTGIINYFEGIDGVINVRDSLEESTGDFTFTVDKQKANFYGLDIATIAGTLRNAIFGVEASTVTLDGDEIDITVKYNKDKFNDASDLENILIITPAGLTVPLRQVAELKIEPSLLSISHRNGDRVVIVRADVEEGVNLQNILKDFEEFTTSLTIPTNYAINVGGEVEDIEQSFRETFLSMIVAVILIAFILVLQFNSFRQPFIIIFVLPLAIIGVIFGLNVLRMPFSFTAFIGIVALSGIVVNDAIVLIDRVNKNISYGMEFIESIIEGGLARMQPIFLTTLTTVAGVFPLIFADELWRGLAVSIIFGLTFSTILTLIMVPIMYVGFCRKEKC